MPIFFFVKELIHMITVIERINPSLCPNCNNESIELFDNRNRKINYPLILRYNNKDTIIKKLSSVTLKTMKCNKCGKEFIIDWDRDLPYPLTKKEAFKFFEEYDNA